MIKVSAIIPIYGVEKYIERCVRSLFMQTMSDGIEFIFVDDCTKDDSINILLRTLDDFPNRKNQVTIIHHEVNKGLPEARKTGVNASRGEYIIHCDSDDWVEPDMYELLYNKAFETNADIVGCDFFEELGDRSIVKVQDFGLSNTDIVKHILKGDEKIDSYLWIRLIKSSFFKRNHFRILKKSSYLEDMALSIPIHLANPKVEYVNCPLYHYNCHDINTMSKNITSKRIDSAILVLNDLKINFLYNEYDWEFNLRLARELNPLITYISVYDTDKWLLYSNGLPYGAYPRIRSRISPFLVRNKMALLNKALVKLKNLVYDKIK